MAETVQRSHQLPVIRQWSATCYLESDKKWPKGCLMLTNKCLLFKALPSEKIHLAIDIDSIIDVKVERSWLGYNTLVVLLDRNKFWFSSFSSSLSVKQVLLHFVKQSLLSNQSEKCAALSTESLTRTKFGSELLSIATDSQRTLSEAASQLVTQGEQLDNAFMTTDVIERDLGIGSNNIAHLESWLGHWQVSTLDLAERTSQVQSSPENKADEQQEFPVVFKSKSSIEEPGVLTVNAQQILIQDERKKTAFTFGYREVSVINVSTPWTMVITRRMMGQADIQCHVTSTRIISILKALEPRVKNKIEYDEPYEIAFTSTHAATEKFTDKRRQLVGINNAVVETTWTEYKSPDGNEPIRGQQIQVTSQSKMVTEVEAAELCNVLKDLKSLALGVGSELDVQDEKIANLTETVTNLTEDVQSNNKRMQRLL